MIEEDIIKKQKVDPDTGKAHTLRELLDFENRTEAKKFHKSSQKSANLRVRDAREHGQYWNNEATTTVTKPYTSGSLSFRPRTSPTKKPKPALNTSWRRGKGNRSNRKAIGNKNKGP